MYQGTRPPEAQPEPRIRSTGLYRAIIAVLHSRIRELRWTMHDCDARSGNQDGYTAKMLHPDTLSGRQARWETIENITQALYPHGYTLVIVPREPMNNLSITPGTLTIDDLLTPAEAAQRMRVSEDTLERQRAGGVGPPFRKDGRRVRYWRSGVEDWIARGRPERASRTRTKRQVPAEGGEDEHVGVVSLRALPATPARDRLSA